MYAVLHWTNWLPKILEFSKRIVDAMRETRVYKSGKFKGVGYDVTMRHMPSLKEAGLKMYRAYSANERAVLLPQTRWLIYPPGESLARVSVSLPWHVND